MTASLTTAAVTHPGRVRRANEDSLLVTSRLVAVADGLGGHASGEVASRIAVDRLHRLESAEPLTPDDVAEAITDANRLILRDARAHRERHGMGTTLTGLALVTAGGAERAMVFNVGDSRVYRWSEDAGLVRVTVDHSEVEELRAAGRISAAEAAVHPRRNVVMRCLGTAPAPTPDRWLLPVTGHARYLVCSDGLTLEVADEEIGRVLAGHPQPGTCASALLERALAAGGRDNIAVIVVDLRGGAEPGAVVVGAADIAPRGRITQRS